MVAKFCQILKSLLIKKIAITLLLATGIIFSSKAQDTNSTKGNQSLAININPVFNYFGQLFTENGSTNLGIRTYGLLYRKYKTDTKAIRLSGNLDFSSDQYRTSSDFPNTQEVVSSSFSTGHYSIRVKLGMEYHKPINNWSLYYGWYGSISLLGNYQKTERRTNLDNQLIGSTVRKNNIGPRIGLGPGIFTGAQYYFSWKQSFQPIWAYFTLFREAIPPNEQIWSMGITPRKQLKRIQGIYTALI